MNNSTNIRSWLSHLIFMGLFFLLPALLSPLSAQTHISAQRINPVFDSTGNPYLIDEEMVVSAGHELTIKPGVVLLFKEYTGIRVEGKLSVEGTSEHPVIFTSINDRRYNKKSTQDANAFDWNGIVIDKDAPLITMRNFELQFSVYGIKSQTPDLTIQNGIFKQNGLFNFTISDKIQPTQAATPFNYSLRGTQLNAIETPASSTKKSDSHANKNDNTKNIIRFSSLGVSIAGCAAGAFFAYQSADNQHKQETIDSINFSTAQQIALWDQFDQKIKSNLTGAIVSFVLGGLGLCGFTLTFLF